MKRTILVIAIALIAAGCVREMPKDEPGFRLETNMFRQPRYEAQDASEFFPDGSAMRMPVEGTIARGELHEDVVYYTGITATGDTVAQSPVPTTMTELLRGQERFNIYCSPCHGRTGDGQGMVVKRGLLPPPNFTEDRLLTAPDGHIFNVITNGIRNMPPYKYQIPVADRWAIIAYFRALQRSQHATPNDVPGSVRGGQK